MAHPPVALRPARADDLPALQALAASDAVRPFVASNAAETLARSAGDPAEQLLVVEASGAFAGGARLVERVPRHRLSEIRTLMIDPVLRGRGLGTATVRALAALAFGQGAHRLEGEVLERNRAGLRAFEAAGFVREGVRRRAWQRDGEWQSSVLLGLLAEEHTG